MKYLLSIIVTLISTLGLGASSDQYQILPIDEFKKTADAISVLHKNRNRLTPEDAQTFAQGKVILYKTYTLVSQHDNLSPAYRTIVTNLAPELKSEIIRCGIEHIIKTNKRAQTIDCTSHQERARSDLMCACSIQ